ncbi:oxidoreductase [Aestuariispira ectoiniformans]|uniref:oxidoreductase n=1 Tax=Aestuariispira ectoiniformans TaxID=2775080 RepID=UPI00223C281F|nr:oxidoreductase [Aestuariispira ectoiniformans]
MNTRQAPLESEFGAASTAADVIAGHDLGGKLAIVTGGYSGIGLEAARLLSEAGARVIVPARNLEKARKALMPFPAIEIEEMDLMDPASVGAFCDRIVAGGAALHLLINNAAVMACPLTRDARGFEAHFATNHLGHFQLTAGLWTALTKAHGARVIAMSSRAHRRGQVDFDDPNFKNRPYDRWEAYGQSKTANALFAVALDRRGADRGIRAVSVHPGGILDTNISRHMSEAEIEASGFRAADGQSIVDPEKGMKTIAQGAATTLWCAVSPQLDNKGGVYCEDCNIAVAEEADSATLSGVRPWARDPALADRLWRLSEEMTGITVAASAA